MFSVVSVSSRGRGGGGFNVTTTHDAIGQSEVTIQGHPPPVLVPWQHDHMPESASRGVPQKNPKKIRKKIKKKNQKKIGGCQPPRPPPGIKYTPLCGQTDACKNITLATTSLRPVKYHLWLISMPTRFHAMSTTCNEEILMTQIVHYKPRRRPINYVDQKGVSKKIDLRRFSGRST